MAIFTSVKAKTERSEHNEIEKVGQMERAKMQGMLKLCKTLEWKIKY